MNASDAVVDECKNLLDRDHLHVNELVDRIRCTKLLSPDTHRLELINAEYVLPELQQGRELLCPLFFVYPRE